MIIVTLDMVTMALNDVAMNLDVVLDLDVMMVTLYMVAKVFDWVLN